MKFRLLLSAAVVGSLVALGSLRAADEAAPGPEVKCPVSGKAVNPKATVEYNGGKVYFCCNNCPKAFKADTAKYAAKANHQLVQTKQLTQVACPITGKPTKAETAIEVGGVSVAFCCNNCKGKVNAATGDEQLELVFGENNKGFKAEKK